jgi:hypothetical protein
VIFQFIAAVDVLALDTDCFTGLRYLQPLIVPPLRLFALRLFRVLVRESRRCSPEGRGAPLLFVFLIMESVLRLFAEVVDS